MRTLTRGLLAAAGTVTLLGLGAGAAQAQFLIDHYKVYIIQDPATSGLPVNLDDQFGPSGHILAQRDKFANPVIKAIFPDVPPPFPGFPGDLFHPFEHLSWWRFATPEPFGPRAITVENQFGVNQAWVLGPAEYLLVPASKDNPFPSGIELNQHYKCYVASGSAPLIPPVVLSDQFGIFTTAVFSPRYFCNPVEKLGPPPLQSSGPPPRPNDHLACYTIDPSTGATRFVADQVIPPLVPHLINPAEMLCVPSKKILVTPTMGPLGISLLVGMMMLTGLAALRTAQRRMATIA